MMNYFDIDVFIDANQEKEMKFKQVDKNNMLNLASNEMIHRGLNEINIKLSKKLDLSSINNYTYYRNEVEWYSKKLKIDSENLAFFSGSDDAIKIILSSIGRNSNGMIIQTPNYSNYYDYAKLNNINIVNWDIKKDLSFDVDEGISLITKEKRSLVVITNPNGFSGYPMSVSSLEKIVSACVENTCLLILDLAYSDYDTTYYDDLVDKYKNIIVIKTLSKSHGLCGVRFAYIKAPAKIIKYLNCFNGINAISDTSHQIVKSYLTDINNLDNIRNEIIINRDKLIEFINRETQWEAIRSKANFVLIRLSNSEEAENLERYLRERGYLIRNLNEHKNFEGCIRITASEGFITNLLINTIRDYIDSLYIK